LAASALALATISARRNISTTTWMGCGGGKWAMSGGTLMRQGQQHRNWLLFCVWNALQDYSVWAEEWEEAGLVHGGNGKHVMSEELDRQSLEQGLLYHQARGVM